MSPADRAFIMNVIIAVLFGRQAAAVDIGVLETHAVHVENIHIPGIHTGDRTAGLPVIIPRSVEFKRKRDILIGRRRSGAGNSRADRR